MSSSNEGNAGLRPIPYPSQNPVPPSMQSSMKYMFLKFRSFNSGINYPYDIVPELENDKRKDASASGGNVRSDTKSRAQRHVWIPPFAVLYGPEDPVPGHCDPGDVWIKTGLQKSVWIRALNGAWTRWGGNKEARSFSHPWFPDLCLWCSGDSWSWMLSDSLRSYQSRWKKGVSGGRWMKDKGRVQILSDGSVHADLGTDSDAAEQWLDHLQRKEEKPKPVVRGKRSHDQEPTLDKRPKFDQPRHCIQDGHTSFQASDEMSSEAILAFSAAASTFHSQWEEPELPSGPSKPRAVAEDYEAPPSDCCIAGREGKEWPCGTPLLSWPNGLKTVLPFVKSDISKTNLDAEAVKNMAKSKFVPIREGDGDSPVVVIRLREESKGGLSGLTRHSTAIDEQNRVTRAIREAQRAGKTALILGWRPEGPRIDFDEPGLESLRGTLDAQVQWQCASKRDAGRASRPPGKAKDLHRFTTLRSFIRLANEPNECGNLLDVPDANGEVPWFIRLVSDDMASLKVTEKVGFSKQARGETTASSASVKAAKKAKQGSSSAPSKKRGKSGTGKWTASKQPTLSSLLDAEQRQGLEEQALEITMGETEDDLGPQSFSFDSFKLRNWSLVSMRGFYTYPHFDVNGYSTWVSMRCGAKWWGIRPFSRDRLEGLSTEDVVQLYESMCSGEESIIGYSDGDGYIMFLHEEITLIIPPGLVHEVYTPCNSIAIGGHFLTYSAMHLTQWTRYVHNHMEHILTNADHISIGRSLSRMVIALRLLRDPMPLRTFLSLADMIMAPEDYEAQESEEDPYAPFAREELEEWKEARRIIQVVLDSNAVALAQVRTLSLKPSLNWQDEDDHRMVDLACIRTT